ncbi:hypothetical protein M0804_008314 [Polistes exclamans]|nr:hypothetical protein M0804_008314 [Polistes exclamans]
MYATSIYSNNQTSRTRDYYDESICAKIKKNPLDKDFKDFLKLIPAKELASILEKYSDDEETLKSFAWILGCEYSNMTRALENLPEYKALIKYIHESGYNGMVRFRILHDAYGSEEYIPPSLVRLNSEEMSETGINGYLKEYFAILPLEEIKRLHDKKMVQSPAFMKFSTYINSNKYYRIVDSLESSQEYKNFVRKSKEAGIDFVAIQNLKLRILGFGP